MKVMGHIHIHFYVIRLFTAIKGKKLVWGQNLDTFTVLRKKKNSQCKIYHMSINFS